MNNIKCHINDGYIIDNNIDYDDIISLVDISIEKKINLENNDKILALKVFYNENYTKKDLDKIAEYYNISKRKKRKSQIIKNIIDFECDESNKQIINRRNVLWFYIEELENDPIMSKYIIFN
jgi:hypothetical protein